MHSEGCASAVKRILSKVEGVTNVETNVAEKSVQITSREGTAEEMVQQLEKVSMRRCPLGAL